MESDVPIRSISRFVAVLQAINRSGSLSMMDIARSSKVPYPTACRIVQTLLHEGLIERPGRKYYQPTALVQTLSYGFEDGGHLVRATRPHLVELTKALIWPATLTTHVGHRMMVRDSTHTITSMTFNNYYPGYTLPILECAAGHAYLAFMEESERREILSTLRKMPENASNNTLALLESGVLVKEILENGLAAKARNQFNDTPGKTSCIAAPIMDGDRVVGALGLVFFASAIKLDDAINTFGDRIKTTAKTVGHDLRLKRIEAAERAEDEFDLSGATLAARHRNTIRHRSRIAAG